MKKQLLMKMLLAVALLGGSMSARAAQSTWSYSTTLASNTIGSAFSGSTDGIVSVQLGADGDGSNWQILNTNGSNRGLAHNDNSVTLTDNVPTAGTFVKVTATQTCWFVLNFYRYGSGYLRLIDAADASTNILDDRHGGSGGDKTASAKLTSGHTYYIYYKEDSSGGNFSITGFTATTYTTYTINYTYGGSIIASEDDEGYIGQTVTAVKTYVWDSGSTTKYYVADNATTSFIVADGTNTFEVALRLAATDAVATVNAIDSENNVLATFTSTGIEGESGYVYYTRAVLYKGSYYAVAAANGTGYNYGKNGVVYGGSAATVTYTLDESINYYTEVENNLSKSRSDALINRTGDWAPNRASGGAWYSLYGNNSSGGAYVYTPSGVLSAGVYSLEVSARNGNGNSEGSYDIKVRTSNGNLSDAVYTLTWAKTENNIKTASYILVPTGASVAICNPNTSNSNVCLDYIILRKLYDVTDASNIIGAVDYSTAYGSSVRGTEYQGLSISKGETLKINFNNHGSATNNWNNWALRITNSGTSFDRGLAGGNHINQEDGEDFTGHDAYYEITQKWFIDGVDNYTSFMDAYKTQMQNANVDMTIEYGTDGTFSVTTESTMGGHEYKYEFTRTTAFSGDVALRLGVDNAWLEILSTERTISATIPTSGFGTIASAYALDCANLPSGVTAYKVSSISASAATLTEVTEAVAAGTGLILSGTAGTYSIPVATSGSDISKTNKLKAAVTATTLDDGSFYILQSGKFCLVTGTKNEADRTVPAGKAYLLATDVPSSGASGARALTFTFGDEASGVEEIENGKLNIENGVYDLQGRRVNSHFFDEQSGRAERTIHNSQLNKGLYIVNGKKVIR